jgi:hypothetical protein
VVRQRAIARPSESEAAADAGTLYAVNTVGAALGASAAMWHIPSIGLRRTTWIGIGRT